MLGLPLLEISTHSRALLRQFLGGALTQGRDRFGLRTLTEVRYRPKADIGQRSGTAAFVDVSRSRLATQSMTPADIGVWCQSSNRLQCRPVF